MWRNDKFDHAGGNDLWDQRGSEVVVADGPSPRDNGGRRLLTPYTGQLSTIRRSAFLRLNRLKQRRLGIGQGPQFGEMLEQDPSDFENRSRVAVDAAMVGVDDNFRIDIFQMRAR